MSASTAGAEPRDPFVPVDRDDPMTSHVEVVGPFSNTYVLLNGFRVPHLTVGERSGGIMEICVDHRLAFDVPLAEFDNVVALVAAAIAIERGYPHFPNGEQDRDMCPAFPFGGTWHGITSVETEDD
jgi:hypothetical protein